MKRPNASRRMRALRTLAPLPLLALVAACATYIGAATASITDAEATSGATGVDSSVSATVDSNAIKASATGNDFTNTIDLAVILTVATLGAGDGAAALGFSINSGPISTALARGNAATNALNYSAGANYGIGTGDAATSQVAVGIGSTVDGQAMAQAAVLNAQVNIGPVTASATGASYSVALNGGAGVPATTNGTIALTGSTVSAAAYGNNANNSMTLASLNSGQPTAAIGNYQTNVGPVTASVTSVTYGVGNGLGAVTGSTHSVTGNQITASAVGNSAVSTIGAR